jgi:3-hydroxyacyl-[acyl-carrier-protein] dehydratase
MTAYSPITSTLDIDRIKLLLPHRSPILLVEKLADIVPCESATGYKAVSFNDPWFHGHFPEFPVMPGVLIVEAMAQTAGALVAHSLDLGGKNLNVFFMTIDKARFRRPVRPGDMLRIPVQALKRRGPVWRFKGEAYVDDALCAEAEVSAMIRAADGSHDSSSDSDR